MPTYTPLESIALTSAAASVTFSNISQNYQDLIIVTNVKSTSTGNMIMRFNSDSSALYSRTVLSGDGSSAQSARNTGFNEIYTDYNGYFDGSNFNQTKTINIMNYSNTTTFKTCLIRSSRAQSGTDAIVGLYRSTNAITSILLSGNGLDFAAGSTFDLYGISPAAANTTQAFGGTEVFYDSSYVYHVFKASGTFTPYRNLTADVLVVAGGGGGGDNYSAGSGAGDLRLLTSQSLTSSTNYTCTIGAGGASAATGNNGNNSSFAGSGLTTISTTGGGKGSYGGNGGLNTGSTGGSGGGNCQGGTGFAGNAGGYTPVEGFAGGNSGGAPNGGQGGGGGAGGVGGNGTGTTSPANGGNGGIGATSSTLNAFGAATGTGQLSGGNYYYAGGGGGGAFGGTPGTGGLGGGGNASLVAGGSSNPAQSGTTNTGGGGGGAGINSAVSGSGGSGIVIVRYAR